jgi:subtilisin family serine protease
MKSSRWGVRALAAGTISVLAGFAFVSGQGATAARVAFEQPTPKTFLLKLDEPSTVRVFRQNRDDGLRSAKVAARSQKSEITAAQSDVIAELPANADPVYRTHAVLAGVGVSAPAGDKTLLEQIPGVSAVYPVAPKNPENSYAIPFQAGAQAWQSTGFLGQGETIAVIDSGVDYTHSNFGGPGTVAAYNEAHAAEDQAIDPDLIDEDKFADGVGIDLVGDSYDADPDSDAYQPDPHPDPNPLDCGGHGSHVAGSAAGYGVNADGTTYTGAYNGSTDFDAMKIGPGMAPEARLFAIKVFGCDGSTNVVTEAIDRAVDPNNDGDPSDHADVINMSLGSDFGSVQDGDSVASNAAVDMGVTVVTAAGNAGDQTDVTGSPGDASKVLSVASSVDAVSKIDGAAVTIDGSTDHYAITRSENYDWKSKPDLSGPVVAAPAGNETACSPYSGTPFTGKVVLVKWHDASPECGSIARGDNLAAAGAIGFIFGSDAESFSAGIYGSDQIPGVLMAASGADAIRDGLDNSLAVTVDGTDLNSITQVDSDDNDKVSTFSSRGIHAVGNVKPDVTAVGNTVFSTAVGSGDDGISYSGTSMASPMVAGLAALVRQAHPGWTPLQVKADIMNTAGHDLYENGSADPSSNKYGPTRVGSGRIDAKDATENKVLAYDATNGAVSVSFGPVAASEPVTLSREVTVDNQSSMPVDYDLDYDPINEVPGADFSVSPSEVSLDPGETTKVTVTLEIDDPSQLTKAIDPTAGRFGLSGELRETLAEAYGRLLLEPSSGPSLRVPVYASPRPASDMTQRASLEIHRTAATADNPNQQAGFELSGQGLGAASGDNGVGDGDPDNDIFSIAAGFELQATSGEAPECDEEITDLCWRLPEEKYSDLKLVGYTSNAPLISNPAHQLAYFAAAVQAPAAIPANKSVIQFDLDVDGDGTPDLFLYNDRLGDDDTFVSTLLDPSKPAGQRVIDQQLIDGRFGDIDTALYDSDVMVLPVSLAALADYGIDQENPRIKYGVETYSWFSDQAIDMIGVDPETGDLKDPLSANLFTPGISVTDDGGHGPLVEDQPGEELTVKRNVAAYEADSGKGVLMLHFHNQVGQKAQVLDLKGAGSTTSLSVAPGGLTARVKAVGNGLPEPSGKVAFSVNGSPIGSATLQDGVAVLEGEVTHGGTRLIKAEYQGSADFEPSSDQVERTDPELTAKIKTRGKNRFGWYRKPVDVYFTCTPHGSDLTEGCPSPRRLKRDGRGQQVKATIVAQDGGEATVTVGGINIDRTKPKVRIRGVRRGATYKRVRRARCAAHDRTSGMRSCGVRWKRRGHRVIYTATGIDRAGNKRVVRVRVRVKR